MYNAQVAAVSALTILVMTGLEMSFGLVAQPIEADVVAGFVLLNTLFVLSIPAVYAWFVTRMRSR